MRHFLIIIAGLFFFVSCVSSKKYQLATSRLAKQEIEMASQKTRIDSLIMSVHELQQSKTRLEKEINHQLEKVNLLQREIAGKSMHITDLQNEMERVKQENVSCLERNAELTHTQSVYAGITRNLISDLEVQQLKVMNLTLALERMDSLNIHLVKKSKKELSDKKYKKALEKLGFVFQ